jgi:hypothetical protein
MLRTRSITIRNPTAGVVTAFEFQGQPPFSCLPGTVNVWPVDCKTRRRRTSIRPRLAEFGSLAGRVCNLSTIEAAVDEPLGPALLAISGGSLHIWDGAAWDSIGGTFSNDRYITADDWNEQLYIADGTVPQVYDSGTDTLADLVAGVDLGDVPEDCTLVCSQFDRIILGGDPANPAIINFGRAGDPTDWLYGKIDVGAPVSSADAQDEVTAFMPHNNDCLLVGCDSSTKVIRGDPMDGGRFATVSHNYGPLMSGSWCKTDDEQTAIWTKNGIYIMPPGCGDALQSFSRKRVPGSLLGIDPDVHDALLGFDGMFNGVHIYKSGTEGSEQWWLDWEDGGFWPMEYTATEKPRHVLRVDPLDGDGISGTLVGGDGGGVRRFDSTADAVIINARLVLGPIRISPTVFHQGMILRVNVRFGRNITDTTGLVLMYAAPDAESAYEAYVNNELDRRYDFTVTNAQQNWTFAPMIGGHALVIVIALGDTDKFWALEQVELEVADYGAQRLP